MAGWRDALLVDNDVRQADSWRDAPLAKVDKETQDEAWRDAPLVSESRIKSPLTMEAGPDGQIRTTAQAFQAETPEEVKVAKEFMLARARRQVRASPLRDVFAVTHGLGSTLISGAARLTGQTKTADYMERYADALRQASSELDIEEDHPLPPIVRRGVRGSAESLGLMAFAAPAGPYAIYAVAGLQEANQSITEGKDAGLKGKELFKYAVAQGTIEAGVGSIFQKLGFGGIEKIIGGRTAIAAGVSRALKQAGITILQELPEELITELGHNLERAVSGVDPEAMSTANIMQTAADTTIQTFITWGFVSGSRVALSSRAEKQAKIQQEIVDTAESGKAPSRKQWSKKWGLPVDKIKSAKDRLEAVQELAGEIQAQREAPSEQVAPEAPAAPEVTVTPEGEEVITTPRDILTQEEVISEPIWKTEGPATTEKGEVSQFIEGPEGEIGVSLKALSKGIGFVKHVGQRFWTARGELPASVYKENVRKDGTISKIQREISFKIKDYERAVKSEFGKRDLTNEETVAFNAALKGEVPLESLPEKVAIEVGIQRNYIDALSGRAIEIGAIKGPLVGIVNKNKGIYIHRSYKKHEPGLKWAEEVPVEIRNIAEAHLRQGYPNKTEPEIQGLIEKLLYEGSASESPIASLRKSGLGAKDIRVLMKRGDFSPEIRDLMGEYKETRVNFAKSATYLGNLIANHQFLESVRELGMGTFLSDVPVVNDYGELKTRIAADESNTMNPLNGLYTTPEIKEAFERASGKGSNKPVWLRWAMTTNAIVKMAKTVGSAGTHVRNFIAGTGFALMQGHWRVGKLYHSYKGIATNITKKNDAEWRAYTLRLIELRVIGQGVRAGELRAHIRDNANMSEVEFDDSVTSRRAKKTKKLTEKVVRGGLDVVQGAYLAEDDFWKIYGYENELADHRKALPELPISEVEEIAAEKLTNTYPTWFRVPEGVRIMRHLPVGPFVSFPAEIVRTAYHTANYAQQELRDPRLRKIGARRLVGMTMAMTASRGLAEAFKMIAKISADDDEDLRWFVPPWQKNSVLLHLGKIPLVAGKAVYRYVDASYSDPHNTLITPFNAMASGKDPKEGIWNAIKDFAEPYVGEEILHGKIVDVWSNNDNGVPVYNPQDSVNKQAQDVSAHLWEAFEPGTITSGRRIYKGAMGTTSTTGRTYNPWVESIAVITGQRIQDLDVAESLKWRARDYNRGIRQANRLLNSVITRGGSVSEAEIRDAYERSDTARRGLFSDMSGAAQAAIRLDVYPDEVETTLVANGVSKIDIPNVMGGVYSKRRITNAQLRGMEQANLSEFPMRLEVLEDLLNKDVDF